MPFAVIQPPADEQKFADTGKQIYQAAQRFGLTMNVEGFLQAWATGTRVAVELDAEGNIVGLALVVIGNRWVQNDFTASVVYFHGSDELNAFLLTICSALGARSMYRETALLTRGQQQSTFEITEYHLQ